jgi:DNA-directed RNA polymerase subunit alpha
MTAVANLAAILDRPQSGHAELMELRAAVYASEDAWRAMRERVTEGGDLKKLPEAKRVKHAYALYLLGRHGVALEDLGEAKADKDASAAWVLGLCHLAAGDARKAADVFAAALKKDKSDLPLQLASLEARRHLGESTEVLDEARALAKKNAKNADALYQVAAALEATGAYDQAMDAYEETLAVDPTHAPTLFRLAFNHEQRGSELVALDYYKRIGELTPTYANALVNCGLLLEDQGRFDLAIEAYKKVLRAEPHHERARIFLKDAEASLDMYYDEDMERRSSRRNAILRIPITDFELSVRARNCLNKMNIRNLGDLVTRTEEELLAYKNFGETSLHEIKQMLAQKGLRLGMFRDGQLDEEVAPEGEGKEPGEEKPSADEEILKKAVGELDVSVRAKNCMERLGVRTIGDLVAKSEPELLAVKNFGQTSLNELKQKLAEHGLTLRA